MALKNLKKKQQYVHLQQQRISMITKESKKEYSTKSPMQLQTKRISKIYLTRAINICDTKKLSSRAQLQNYVEILNI